MTDFPILTVCTANICRSPAAERLLLAGLADLAPEATVSSAGVAAVDGRPACDLSSALIGEYVATEYPGAGAPADFGTHRSRRLTAEHARGSELILALDRSHRAELARLAPARRPVTFTLRQAATLATAVAAAVADGGLPQGAPPLPADRADRLRWWVAEMDAARGLTGDPGDSEQFAGDLWGHPLDVPDPHAVGYQYHPVAVELIERAVDDLVAAAAVILSAESAS